MELEFFLKERDFFIFQLYNASKSRKLRNKRLRTWLVIPALYLGAGIWLNFVSGLTYLTVFGIAAIGWLIGYPVYSRWNYKMQFAKYVRKNYQDRIDKKGRLGINESQLYYSDESASGTYSSDDIKNVIEIRTHYFVVLGTGTAFILPKEHLKQKKLLKFVEELKQLAGLEVQKELDWKWI